jgi:3'-phosphoadenosine 5'-phosphosulfate (PAPS) 3'-phosphatase
MTKDNYADDLRLAHVIADQVDSITMSRFKALDLKVETKPDLTPVTDADRAAEDFIRGQLARARTRDAIVGEEYGSAGNGARRWIVDPIDGTKNFVRGVPVWATLIALADGDEVVVGLVSAPALARHLFRTPTWFYKTGIVFLAWLAGHQDHFTMVGGAQSGRSPAHLAELLRLADAAGLLPDAELAAHRARAYFTTAGVAQ